MTNIYFFISLVLIFTLLFGKILQKLKIPWIFSPLILGVAISKIEYFQAIANSESFGFLANLGMYFLLFLIGFEINIKEIKKSGKFILQSTIFITLLGAVLGGLVIHFLFDYSWLVSFIVATSFATVGEAILLPILDKFKITKTRLGQIIIGVGTLDDIIEVLIFIFVVFFIGSNIHGYFRIGLTIFYLGALFAITYGLTRLKKQSEKFHFLNIETLFLFVLATFFLFLSIGSFAEATALGSVLAGLGLRTFIPDERLVFIENEIKAISYGFLAPLFFLWVGINIDLNYLIAFPILTLILVLVSAVAKYLGSYLVFRKKYGLKQSVLIGTALSVRFSTSIVIIKILLDNGIVKNDLYTVIIATSIVFTIVIPVAFSSLLSRWHREVAN